MSLCEKKRKRGAGRDGDPSPRRKKRGFFMNAAVDKVTALAQGCFLRMELVGFTDERGRKRTWERVSRIKTAGAALIVPRIVPDDLYVLIRQFRAAAGKYVIEFPAGLVEPGEGAEATAVRELYEETGYEGRVVRILEPGISSPGLSDEAVSMVVMEIDAERYRTAPPVAHPEDSESIEIFTVPAGEMAEFVSSRQALGDGIDIKLQAFLLGMCFSISGK